MVKLTVSILWPCALYQTFCKLSRNKEHIMCFLEHESTLESWHTLFTLTLCLFCCSGITLTKTSLGRKGLFRFTAHRPSLREVRAGAQAATEAEAMREPHTGLLHSFSQFLILPRSPAHDGNKHSRLGPLRESLIKAMSHRHGHGPTRRRQFLNYFPSDSSLCQVHTNTHKQPPQQILQPKLSFFFSKIKKKGMRYVTESQMQKKKKICSYFMCVRLEISSSQCRSTDEISVKAMHSPTVISSLKYSTTHCHIPSFR